MYISTTVKKMREGVAKLKAKGATFREDGEYTEVEVSGVGAKYKYNPDTSELFVVITEVPFLVSESFVEDKIREFFE